MVGGGGHLELVSLLYVTLRGDEEGGREAGMCKVEEKKCKIVRDSRQQGWVGVNKE